MKKFFYTISSICISIFAGAQNSIPNGDFETWTSFTYDVPSSYTITSSPDAYFKCGVSTPNAIKNTDAYHGTYSLGMTTVAGNGDTCDGYIVNTIPEGNFPNWVGGLAYNQAPTGIRGYYKSAIASPDTGRVLLIFKSAGTPIGTYLFPLYGTHSTYTLFNFTLSPALPSNPDTLIVAFASSDFANEYRLPGSMLMVDSITFTGVSSQPALFNGDFENWQSVTIDSPTSWYLQSSEGAGVARTTDMAAGNYAIQLVTYPGDNNGVPRAQAGTISNGYWDNNCNCWKGGLPFSNQTDTLVFSYKYTPTPNDTAEVILSFKKLGNQFGNVNKKLGASATYQTVEVPFTLGQAPDSVVTQIQSSMWKDSALTFIGSILKIDEIHFKSQSLNTSVPALSAIQNSISIYPNPSNGEFTIQSSLFNVQNIEVYNAIGEKVVSKTLDSKTVNLNLKDQGIYFVKMISNGKTFTKKLTVNR